MEIFSKIKKSLFSNFRHKYKLVIQDETTFDVKFTFRLSRMNVFVALGMLSIFLILGTTFIIAYTPLREYIPGYPNVTFQKQLYKQGKTVDSLLYSLHSNDLYYQNLKNILEGNIVRGVDSAKFDDNINTELTPYAKSKEDSQLRIEMAELEKFNLLSGQGGINSGYSKNSISNFFFFTPINGKIINGFDPVNKHFGIDIVARENEAVKSTLDGTVLFANWTLDMGWVIGVQHENNLISVYKHNSTLLKKIGDFVKAGEPVAIVGNTGEMSSGTHLHFELWYNGNAVNPQDYVAF